MAELASARGTATAAMADTTLAATARDASSSLPAITDRSMNVQDIHHRSKAAASSSFGSEANKHFKFNFLSAGSVNPANKQTGVRHSRRNNIMDATRTFEHADGDPLLSHQEGKTVLNQWTDPETRISSGLGYGNKHLNHFRYLSKARPPRAAEPWNARPQRFPTAAVTPLLPVLDTTQLSDQQWEQFRAPYKSVIASGLGYGPKHKVRQLIIAAHEMCSRDFLHCCNCIAAPCCFCCADVVNCACAYVCMLSCRHTSRTRVAHHGIELLSVN